MKISGRIAVPLRSDFHWLVW